MPNWEAEIQRITIPSWPRQIVQEIPISKFPEQNELEVWLKW
jgi:hypothetical protein